MWEEEFWFLPTRSNDKFYENYWKITGHILCPFCPFYDKQEFCCKIRSCHFFLFLDFYRCAKFQERLMNRFREKPSTELRKYLLTYRQVDKHEFIEPFLMGIQKVCIVIKPTIPDLRWGTIRQDIHLNWFSRT